MYKISQMIIGSDRQVSTVDEGGGCFLCVIIHEKRFQISCLFIIFNGCISHS